MPNNYPLSNAGISDGLSALAGGDGQNFSIGSCTYTRLSTGVYQVTLGTAIAVGAMIPLATPRGSAALWCECHVDSPTQVTVRMFGGSNAAADGDFDFVAINANAAGEWDTIGFAGAVVSDPAGVASYQRGGLLSGGASPVHTFTDLNNSDQVIALGSVSPLSFDANARSLDIVPNVNTGPNTQQSILTLVNDGIAGAASFAVLVVLARLCYGALANVVGYANHPTDEHTSAFDLFYGAKVTRLGTGHYRMTMFAPMAENDYLCFATCSRENPTIVNAANGIVTIDYVSANVIDVFTFASASRAPADVSFSLMLLGHVNAAA